MNELSERQKVILGLVVHEYVRTAAPVGSKSLVNAYHLDYSPATVRNELAALTEAQYLSQPHTSAGRVPTRPRSSAGRSCSSRTSRRAGCPWASPRA